MQNFLIMNMEIETDSMMVVRTLTTSTFDLSTTSGLIWEMKDLLACNFTSFAVNHIPRSCNLVADSLAALGASLSVGAVPVLDSIPSCMRELVANDLAASYE